MIQLRVRNPLYLSGAAGGAAMLSLALASPASAQEDYRAIVTIMRACAAIDDVAARVMCYDNNIQPPAQADASSGPSAAVAASPIAPVAPSAPSPSGFGSEMVAPPRAEVQARDEEQVIAQVAAVDRVEPGIFLITLADGAQWRFVDPAPNAYDPPRAGAQIELERGSLGSVFLTFADQRRLRVIRVR